MKQYTRNPYKKTLKLCEMEGCNNWKMMTEAGKFCSNKCRQRNKNNNIKGE